MGVALKFLLGPALPYLLGAVAIIGAYWYVDHRAYWRGFDAALTSVTKQNAKAAAVAEGVRRDVDACFDSGGVWNVATGSCDR